MKVLGLAGWSGSGKTTLMVRLIPALKARGLSVSTVKHAHHRFDVDRPGKDSYRHREAGATEVLVASGNRYALMHELRDEPQPPLTDLLEKMSPVDLVLVEGFKREGHAKIEVHREANGKPPLHPDDDAIIAVAADGEVETGALPRLDLNNVDAIADFAAAFARTA
jgi:molybdopterin-guanine dinucleotide biosynthesis protein B